MQRFSKWGLEPLGYDVALWREECRVLQLSTSPLVASSTTLESCPGRRICSVCLWKHILRPTAACTGTRVSLLQPVPLVRWTAPQACTTACSPAPHSSEDWSEQWRGPPTDRGEKDKKKYPMSDTAHAASFQVTCWSAKFSVAPTTVTNIVLLRFRHHSGFLVQSWLLNKATEDNQSCHEVLKH